MKKSYSQLYVMAILASSVGMSQAMQPYGQPGMQPMHPHDAQKMQRKAYKNQIKQEQMRQFFSQNPRASKDQWENYWKQYKRMHGID